MPSIARRLSLFPLCIAFLLGATSCSGSTEPAEMPTQDAASYNPRIEVLPSNFDVIMVDSKDRAKVAIYVNGDGAELLDTSPTGSAAFSAAYAKGVDNFVRAVSPAIESFPVEVLNCVANTGVEADCVMPLTVAAETAEIFEGAATVTLTGDFLMGNTSTSKLATSFTIDAETGQQKTLADYPVHENEVSQAGTAASNASQVCTGATDFKLSEDTAWSPTPAGLQITWTTQTAQLSNACGRLVATVPWPGEETTEAPLAAAPALPASCDALIPPGVLSDSLSPNDGQKMSDIEWAQHLLGPKTFETLRNANQQVFCFWGAKHSGNIVSVSAAIIDESAKTALLTALEDPDYVNVTDSYPGVEAVFQYDQIDRNTFVLFDGSVLIATAPTTDHEPMLAALESIRRSSS